MKQPIHFLDLEMATKIENRFDKSECECEVVEQILKDLNIDFENQNMVMIYGTIIQVNNLISHIISKVRTCRESE
jgi:hypothetical protein